MLSSKKCDFKWCIWAIPSECPLSKVPNGFPLHMTIKSHLREIDAQRLFALLRKRYCHVGTTTLSTLLEIELDSTIQYSHIAGFYALSCNIVHPEKLPDGFVGTKSTPHVSFQYQHSEFKPSETSERITHTPDNIKLTLVEIRLVKCTGHWVKWTI